MQNRQRQRGDRTPNPQSSAYLSIEHPQVFDNKYFVLIVISTAHRFPTDCFDADKRQRQLVEIKVIACHCHITLLTVTFLICDGEFDKAKQQKIVLLLHRGYYYVSSLAIRAPNKNPLCSVEVKARGRLFIPFIFCKTLL